MPGNDGNKIACAKVRTAEEVATKVPLKHKQILEMLKFHFCIFGFTQGLSVASWAVV